jgi:hypothetical protein
MVKRIAPLGIFLFLVGCGGSSEQNIVPEQVVIKTTSTANFYIAPWQSNAGTLILTNNASGERQTFETSDLNSLDISLTSLANYSVEFVSNDDFVLCPSYEGCGRTYRDNPDDTNANRQIDFEEVLPLSLDYSASFFAAPGENRLFLSPVSAVISAQKLDVTSQSVSATPFYHLTHSQLNDSLEAELLTNALSFGVILKRAAELEANLSQPELIELESQAQISRFPEYAQYANRYIRENLLNVKGNQLIQTVVGNLKQRLVGLGKVSELSALDEQPPILQSRELLDDIRNVIGVVRLQEQQYSAELSSHLNGFTNALDDDSQSVVVALANVLFDVLSNVSPADDTLPGLYTVNGLTVQYQHSPYRWSISGQYDGIDVNMDINVPQWRISSLLGNQITGVMSAQMSSNETQLLVDVSELLLSFDGTDDPFTILSEDSTGEGTLNTDITLVKKDSELVGNLNLTLNRFVSPFEELLTIVSDFDLDGEFSTASKTTSFNLQAIEATPFINEETENLVFALHLGTPLNGATDFEFGFVGKLTALAQLTNTDIFIRQNSRALDINLRTVGNNVNAVIKGADGRWLDLKQKGRNFSGGLYFGDTQIGDVTTVRGAPGILFPDGTFESLF